MSALHSFSTLVLRPFIRGCAHSLGVSATDVAVGLGSTATVSVLDRLRQHFNDPTQRLPKALDRSCQRAWRALEITLAGNSLLSRLHSTEDKALREQIRIFLDHALAQELVDKSDSWLKCCLKELRSAKKTGLLTGGEIDPQSIETQFPELAREESASGLIETEWKALEALAETLRANECPNLASLVSLRSQESDPLLVLAVRWFFQREIEQDEVLSRTLTMDYVTGLIKKPTGSV